MSLSKLNLFLIFVSLTFSGIAQTVLFSEDFGSSFQDIYSGTNWECKHTSASSYNSSGGPCYSSGDYNYYLNGYDVYITSKEITLGASGNELSFDYSFEYYSFASPEVRVLTGACGSSGTDITGGTLVETSTCDYVSFSLDAYANQTIRLVFYSNTTSENFYFDNVEVTTGGGGGGGGEGDGLDYKWADTFNDNDTDLDFTGNNGDESYTDAIWTLVDGASIASSGSYTVNHNETEAFNTTTDDNSGYGVLLDKNESLESPTVDLSAQESFKISFYAMKQGGSANWNSWTKLYLEYWDGSAWQTLQIIKNSATATSEENDYFIESGFGYHCFTVYKSSSSPGNYYYSSGDHINSACFHSDFKLRWRMYESTSDNPQVYIDNITFRADDTGEDFIPCGISYWNGVDATGFGLDSEATTDDPSKRGLEVEIDSPWETGNPDWSNDFDDGNTGVEAVYAIMYAVVSEQKISTNDAKVVFILPDAKTVYSETMSVDNNYTGPGFLYYKKVLADCSGSSVGTYDTGNGMTYYFLFEYSSDFRPVFYHLNTSGIEMHGAATETSEFMDPEICNSVLPIELMMFEASVLEQTVKLEWLTASELNCDYYNIQRSENGIVFNDLEYVSGMGNSNSNVRYFFVDEKPLNGQSYYRIQQVDFDGTESLSDVISVDFSADQLDVFPNPINGVELYVYSSEEYNNTKIEVLDISGKCIYSNKKDISIGKNIIKFSEKLNQGTYMINISLSNRDVIMREKLIVTHP